MSVHARLPWKSGVIGVTTLLCAACAADGPAGPAGNLRIDKHPQHSGDGQIWETGHIPPQPFVVRVTRDGQPVEGMTVRWQPTPGSGWAVYDSTVTDAAGDTGIQWRLGTTAGTHHLEASVEGADGSPVVFSAVANPNLPFGLTVVSGDGATVSAGGSVELVVRVGDEFDNPYPGATVYWSVVSGPATLDTGSSSSDASGLAVVEAVTGPTSGTVTVHAWLATTASHPTVFTLTVVP